MFCKKCGAFSEQNTEYCFSCGEKTEQDGLTGVQPDKNSTNSNASNSNMRQQSSSLFSQADFENITKTNVGNSSSTAALTLGIIGIIFSFLNYCGIPFVHLIGIGLGIAATVLGNSQRKLRYNLATPAMIVGIIALVMGAVAALIGMIAGIMMQSA